MALKYEYHSITRTELNLYWSGKTIAQNLSVVPTDSFFHKHPPSKFFRRKKARESLSKMKARLNLKVSAPEKNYRSRLNLYLYVCKNIKMIFVQDF